MSSGDAASSGDAVSADVVVVGGRIAGTAVAIRLARAGYAVTVVDRAGFPSDTLSTHLIQVSGVRRLQELGVLDDLVATGAPFLTAMSVDYDGVGLHAEVRAPAGWPPGGISVNRALLDEILVRAARREGVDVRLRTSLVDLTWNGAGRVDGVLLRDPDRTSRLRTRLVVGADGRGSRVAALVGARTYNVTANERFVYWADYEGVTEPGPATVHHYRTGADIVLGFRSDTGRSTVIVGQDLAGFRAFRAGLPASFDAAVAGCGPLRPFLGGAARTGRPIGTAYTPGYFRESTGPGWVLLGDAGHFKDPLLGQGISDALRQADRLAAAVVRAPGEAALDRALRRWWRWRDRDAFAMYWLSVDFSQAGVLGDLERAVLRNLAADPPAAQLFADEVLSHRRSPYAVLTPARVARAVWRLHRDGGCTLPVAAGTLVGRVGTEAGRVAGLLRPRWDELPQPRAEPRPVPAAPRRVRERA